MTQDRRQRNGHGTVQLTKKAAPLLRTINSKLRVHQRSKPKSPRSLNASPLSSDVEEICENESVPSGAIVNGVERRNSFAIFSSPPQGEESKVATKKWQNVVSGPYLSSQRDMNLSHIEKNRLRGRNPTAGSNNKNMGLRGKRKRSRDSSPVRVTDTAVILKDDDAELFDAVASSQRSNRQRKYGPTSNIHAAPVQNGGMRDSGRSFGTTTSRHFKLLTAM